jgi:phage tail-like protein
MTTPAPGWLTRQLPVAMLQDDFLVRFTSIFEEVAGTLVDSVDTIGIAADLSITPDPFVHWLGSWIGAPADPEHDRHEVRERDWVRAQARVLSARGTRAGLAELLRELAGGQSVEVVDGGGVYREGWCPEGDTGWVRVRMPLPGGADPQDVLDLIRAEVPIGVDVELVVIPVYGPDGALIPAPRTPESETLSTGLDPVAELSAAARRLPGTGGRAGRPGRICPGCAERNEAGVSACQRCGSPMRVVPVPVAEPEPVRVVPEPELWLPERRIWPVVALVVVVVVLLFGVLLAGPFLF